MRKFFVITTVLCSAGLAQAGDIDLTEINKRIDKLMERPEMVGLAVAIVQDGELILSKGYGHQLKGSSKKVTDQTVFRWASLSKAIAGTAVMQLVENDQIELQRPVADYVTSLRLPDSEFPVTLEDVLAQRTGLENNAYARRIEGGQSAKRVRGDLDDVKRLCAPGACYSYQNVAFDAAAEAVEAVTDLPYKSYVTKSIFQPLGMDTATVSLEGFLQSREWARPHNSYGNPIKQVKPTYYRLPAAAGVNSSVTDLAKWMQAQFDDTSPLSEFVRMSSHMPRIKTPYEDRKMRRYYGALTKARYALGWRIYDFGGRDVVGHRGAVSGYRAHVLFDAEAKTGVAVLWNSNHYRPAGLALEVFDQVYDNPKRDWMRLGPKFNRFAQTTVLTGSGGR